MATSRDAVSRTAAPPWVTALPSIGFFLGGLVACGLFVARTDAFATVGGAAIFGFALAGWLLRAWFRARLPQAPVRRRPVRLVLLHLGIGSDLVEPDHDGLSGALALWDHLLLRDVGFAVTLPPGHELDATLERFGWRQRLRGQSFAQADGEKPSTFLHGCVARMFAGPSATVVLTFDEGWRDAALLAGIRAELLGSSPASEASNLDQARHLIDS